MYMEYKEWGNLIKQIFYSYPNGSGKNIQFNPFDINLPKTAFRSDTNSVLK